MKTIVTIVITLVAGLAVLCLAAYGYLKTHTFAARQKPSALEVAMVTRVRSISMPMSDGALYNVIKNGIPFSGMPAWDEQEPTYWKLVAFVRHLPSIRQTEVGQIQKMSCMGDEDH